MGEIPFAPHSHPSASISRSGTTTTQYTDITHIATFWK
jgi:hypothetical protein